MQPQMIVAALASTLLLAAMIAIVIGSISVWRYCLSSWRSGVPAVPYEPRSPVPWNVLDLLAVLLIMIAVEGTTALVSNWLNPSDSDTESTSLFEGLAPDRSTVNELPDVEVPLDADEPAEALSPRVSLEDVPPLLVGRLLGPLLALLFLRRRAGATWRDLGFSTEHLAADIRLGLCAFLAIAPPVYALQGLLQFIFPGQHPMIDLIEDQPSPAMLGLLSILIVLVAPLTEELIIRVFLQGWLERFGSSEEDLEPRRMPLGLVPILISSTIFAALHAGYGPDPIPIFILALGLGYVYSRTHRIWPGLVLHLSLNGSSTVALMLALAIGEPPT